MLAVALLAAACSPEPPPMPDGAVPVAGASFVLGPVAGHASEVSADPQALARLGLRWLQTEPGDAQQLALARTELLRTPPNAAALMNLDRIGAPTCDALRTRAVARLVRSELGEALQALQECTGPSDDALREGALTAFAVHRVDQPALGLEPRALHRAGPRLLLEALASGAPSEELVALSAAHAQAFAVPEAAQWYAEALRDPPPPAWRAALRELAGHQVHMTADPDEARRWAVELAALASRLRGYGAELPATRAAHLAAWYGYRTGDLGFDSWARLAELARDRWPGPEVEGLTEQAAALVELEARAEGEAHRLLDRAAGLAHRHGLVDAEARVLLAQWELDRRPALAPAEAQSMLDLLGGPLSEAARTDTLRRLGFTAWRAGWPALARAACTEALRDPRFVCRASSCDDVLTFLTPMADRPERIRGLLAARADCGPEQQLVSRHNSLAEALYRTGDRAGAIAELDSARALVPPSEPRSQLLIEATQLLLSDALEQDLAAFDALARAVSGDGLVDPRGWVTAGYREFILERAERGAEPDELWALLVRREALRLGGPTDLAPPPSSDPLALLPSPQDGGLLILSGSSAVLVRADSHPKAVLDLASTESSALIGGGPAGPSLEWLAAQLGLVNGDRLLLQLGSGEELGLPLAALPGLDRPTAQWIPTTTAQAAWSGGVVISGPAEDGLGLYGVHELGSAMADAGWQTGLASSVAQVAALVRGQPVVHISAHGRRIGRFKAALALGPELLLDADMLGALPLLPGSLVTLAACGVGGDDGGELPLDLPVAALQAGAAAVLYSRFPVRSVPLHQATERLYEQLPFPCAELPRRWHEVRRTFGRHLLGVEVAVSATCLEAAPR